MVDIDHNLYSNSRYQNELTVLQTRPNNVTPDWSESWFLPEKYQPQFMYYQLIGDTVSVMIWHGTKKETDAVARCYTRNHCNSFYDMPKLLLKLKDSEMIAKRVILSVGYTECRSNYFNLSKCVSNLKSIISILQKKGCIEIILTNVPPCARTCSMIQHWKCVNLMNKAIKKIGKDYAGVAVCNIFQLFCRPMNFKKTPEYIITGVPNYQIQLDLYNVKSLKNSAVTDLITFSEKGKKILHDHLLKTVNFRTDLYLTTLINSKMKFSMPLERNDAKNSNNRGNDQLIESKVNNNTNTLSVNYETIYRESTKIRNDSSTELNLKEETHEPRLEVNTLLDDRSTIARTKTLMTLLPKIDSTETQSKPKESSAGLHLATNVIPFENIESDPNSSSEYNTVTIQNKVRCEHPVTEETLKSVINRPISNVSVHHPVAAETIMYTIEKVWSASDRITMKRRIDQNKDSDRAEIPDAKKKLPEKCDGLKRSKSMKLNTHQETEAKPAVASGTKQNLSWVCVNASHGRRQQTSQKASNPEPNANNKLPSVSNHVTMMETHSKALNEPRLKQLHELNVEVKGDMLLQPTHAVRRCKDWGNIMKDSHAQRCRTQINIFLQHAFTCNCEICADGHKKLMSSFHDLIKMLKKDERVDDADLTEPV